MIPWMISLCCYLLNSMIELHMDHVHLSQGILLQNICMDSPPLVISIFNSVVRMPLYLLVMLS